MLGKHRDKTNWEQKNVMNFHRKNRTSGLNQNNLNKLNKLHNVHTYQPCKEWK